MCCASALTCGRIHSSFSVLHSTALLAEHHVALVNFIELIVKPVGVEVFGLNPRSLHIFFDLAPSPLIAFNYGGALFLNLRFCEFD